METDSFLVTSL